MRGRSSNLSATGRHGYGRAGVDLRASMRPWILDFFLGEFEGQSQRIGNAVGEVGKSGEHMDVDDFGIGKMTLQRRKIGIVDVMRRARQLVNVAEGRLFFPAIA